ncbi:NADH-quinone oxidoreductase subunit J [Thiolinea disciformis]|uniref:NADH-quinone oxidoreductase subunit J n=1 Tax=Thiolinea disciformis TaxID=125614 RepID=UPI00036B77AF|nr:NADH-quinone oxidoreductase subunit J [Thiolinea disciformis]
MTFVQFLFNIYAGITIAAAIGVVTVRNSVYAALCLILTFFSSAAIWILLEAEFLGIVLVLVYVGAVMVLFLFVIMMLDINREQLVERFIKYLPAGIAVAVIIAIEMIVVIQRSAFDTSEQYKAVAQNAPDYNNTEALGELLYTQYLYPFEIAAVVLLVAIIAAIMLTLRKRAVNVRSQDIEKQLRVRPEDRVRLVKMKSGQ